MTTLTAGAKLRRFARTPKGLLLACFVVLLAAAIPFAGGHALLPGLHAGVLAGMLVDAPILRIRRHRWVFPDGALLTGLIVAMVLSPLEPWWVVAVTSAIAVLSKYVFRVRTANVFNPAALGLVITFYLFDTGQSWWGAVPDAPAWTLIMLFATGAFITWRVGKVPAVLAFLGGYFGLITAAAFVGTPAHVAELFRSPDVNAALYFAFFIATDPPTSPPKARDQVTYGLIIAGVAYVAFETIGAAHFLLDGVLLANIWAAQRRRLPPGGA